MTPRDLASSPHAPTVSIPAPRAGRGITLDALLQGEDGVFVDRAIHALLGRAPHAQERASVLADLRSGRRSRVEVLAAMHASRPPEAPAMDIPGLAKQASWHRLLGTPVVGHVAAMLHALCTLPRRMRAELPPAPSAAAAQDAGWDAYYQHFEDAFRGPRDAIRARVADYLPYVREAGAGQADSPVLDIGCGRGEWLELLRDEGLHAWGVDGNQVAVENCKKMGLQVVVDDAMRHLNGLPDQCVGAVTAFHVIEHIPFEALAPLFDEIMRVLKPGGLVILETPNPENITVGAHWFWFDPTHIRPLPPAPTCFLVASRGFEDARIVRLVNHRGDAHVLPTKLPESHPDANTLNPVIDRLAHTLYAPPDYAVVARKPGALPPVQ